MSTKEAARRASAGYHAKRKAEGWRKVTVWLSPSAVAKLDALKEEHGWATDETIRRLLNGAQDPPERTPLQKVVRTVREKPAPAAKAVSVSVPYAGDLVRKPYQKGQKR